MTSKDTLIKEIEDLVDDFSTALKAKLIKAEEKYNWQGGWKIPNWENDCQNQLQDHIHKGDPLDVAAYAAFMWYHNWHTSNKTRFERLDNKPTT